MVIIVITHYGDVADRHECGDDIATDGAVKDDDGQRCHPHQVHSCTRLSVDKMLHRQLTHIMTSGPKRVPANIFDGNEAFRRRPRHNLEAHRRLNWADPGNTDGGVLDQDDGDGDGDGLETNQ